MDRYESQNARQTIDVFALKSEELDKCNFKFLIEYQRIALSRDKQKYPINQVHLILWQGKILIEKT